MRHAHGEEVSGPHGLKGWAAVCPTCGTKESRWQIGDEPGFDIAHNAAKTHDSAVHGINPTTAAAFNTIVGERETMEHVRSITRKGD